MNRRSIWTAARLSMLVSVLAVAVNSPTASADELTLVSERLRSGSGSASNPMGRPAVFNPTDWSGGPFPDDARNFTALDALGLRVRVDKLGTKSTSFTNQIQGQTTSWSAHDFLVTFRIDRPLEYRFWALDSAAGTPSRPRYMLRPEGQPPLFEGTPTDVLQGSTPRTGILPAGTYTYSGVTAVEGGYPIQPVGFQLFEQVPLRADFTVVAPEPGGLSLVGLAAVCCARRRHRRARRQLPVR